MKSTSFLILILLSTLSFSQRTDFTVTNGLPQIGNPAFTGTAESGRANYGFMLRDPSLSLYGVAHYLAYDQYVNKLRGGIGVQLLTDRTGNGITKTKSLGINYAFQQNLGESFTLSAGAGVMLKNEQMDFTTLFPYYTDSIASKNYFEFTAGLVLYSEHVFAGIQYAPFNYDYYNYDDTFTQRIHYFNSFIGYQLTPFTNKNLSFNTSINFATQNSFHELSIQGIFNTKFFSLGSRYLFEDEISFLAGVNFWKLNLKYAYTIGISKLTNSSSSGHQFILQFNLPNKIERSPNAFKMNLY